MKKAVSALCLLLVFLLSGCSAMSFESTDIMCPPKATGNKAQIQKLIDKQTSGDYTLKYPKNGLNRSSIIMQDIDADDDEEAVAFYADKDGADIHALFVECKDDDYSVINDVQLDATSVDRIDFADIDGDNIDEILIGYSTSTSSQSILNVFSYDGDITKLDISCSYSSLVTGDFNSDKNEDVLLISLFSGDIAAQAKLMIYNNGGLSELSSTELDSDVTSLAATTYGQISYGTYGAVIDGITTTGDYTTQVVYFDPSVPSLLNPLYSYSGYSQTRRSTQVCSLDFDNDELIDIPICSFMGYDSSEDTDTVSRKIDWSNLDTSSYYLDTTKSAIICPADGYLLTMPGKWDGSVTARYDEDARQTTVYVYEYVDGYLQMTDELINIKAYFEDDFEKDDTGYIEFLRAGSTVYTYSIGTADNYLSITGDEVSSLFSLVNQ